MKIGDQFDRWVRSGNFDSLDLGAYRIIYAVGAICIAPSIEWLHEYPDAMYSAPFGPFQAIPGFPSLAVLIALEILRTLALVFLALGLFSKWASIASGVLLLVTYGLTYTLGKIDHTILLVITPLILGFANWGDRLSVDALLRRRGHCRTPQWPLRYLALCIGLAFFVAAAMKLGTGWTAPSSQAVRGYFLEYYILQDRTSGLAGLAYGYNTKALWEFLDWATVILEFAILAAVPWWRAFKVALALIVFFHLGVFLLMNITFSQNLLPYGAFVAWGALRPWVNQISPFEKVANLNWRLLSSLKLWVWFLIGIALTAATWLAVSQISRLNEVANVVTIATASTISLLYLANEALSVVRRNRTRPALASGKWT
ncbi:HTTM domain-containing protein [Mycobacterium sp. ZZG]